MTLMLAACMGCGGLASRGLLWAGLTSLPLRLPLAVLVSWLVLFLLVRLWLHYVGFRDRRRQAARDDGDGWLDLVDDLPWPGRQSGGADALVTSDSIVAGGGEFGGGGASATLDMPVVTPTVKVSSGSGGIDWDLPDLDDGWAVILLGLAIALLLAAVAGGGAWLIWHAPDILGDVAFEAALAGTLLRARRRDADWMQALLTRTWIPFVLIALTALLAGWAAQHVAPSAQTLGGAWQTVWAGISS